MKFSQSYEKLKYVDISLFISVFKAIYELYILAIANNY